jgi:hypothetical protein
MKRLPLSSYSSSNNNKDLMQVLAVVVIWARRHRSV